MNSHAETISSFIIDLVKHAVDHPIHTNIIEGYNKIVYYRGYNKDVSCRSFDSIRQTLNDDEIVIEIFALPRDNASMECIAFSIRKQYEAPHICHLFNEDELNYRLEKGDAQFKDTTLASLLLEPLREELVGVKRNILLLLGNCIYSQ